MMVESKTIAREPKMPRRTIPTVVSALCVFAACSGAAIAQPVAREGKDAFGSWQQDKPGTTRLIRPQDLPDVGATPSAANVSRVVPRPAGAAPQVPAGFSPSTPPGDTVMPFGRDPTAIAEVDSAARPLIAPGSA